MENTTSQRATNKHNYLFTACIQDLNTGHIYKQVTTPFTTESLFIRIPANLMWKEDNMTYELENPVADTSLHCECRLIINEIDHQAKDAKRRQIADVIKKILEQSDMYLASVSTNQLTHDIVCNSDEPYTKVSYAQVKVDIQYKLLTLHNK